MARTRFFSIKASWILFLTLLTTRILGYQLRPVDLMLLWRRRTLERGFSWNVFVKQRCFYPNAALVLAWKTSLVGDSWPSCWNGRLQGGMADGSWKSSVDTQTRWRVNCGKDVVRRLCGLGEAGWAAALSQAVGTCPWLCPLVGWSRQEQEFGLISVLWHCAAGWFQCEG